MFTKENVDALVYAEEKGFLTHEEGTSLLKQALEKAGFTFPAPVAVEGPAAPTEPAPPAPEAAPAA